jgi:hypothetical protein
MASVLPFRPWCSPALRVFESRAARGQSTDPALDLSCTYVPPQRILPKPVARIRKLGRRRLRTRTPRFAPQPFSMHERKNPFFRPARTGRLKGFAVPFKSAAPRVWLPSRRCQLHRSRRPFSASHALGLRPSELFSGPAARPRFPARDPFLRFRIKPTGLVPALQRFPLAKPAVPPALPRGSGEVGAAALLGISPPGLASTGFARKPLSSPHPSRS